MAGTIDLNADLGESFGAWCLGDDAALLEIVTSANVACGFHAGDPDVMARTMAAAVAADVGIGAHPGFADLQGFGRNRMEIPRATAVNLVQYQLGAAQALARAAGGRVRHLKLHGALSNMAAVDRCLAQHLFEGALGVDPDLILVVQAATVMEEVARDLGCAWAGEIFADRAYTDEGLLVDRREDGAVIHDADLAAQRVVAMLEKGGIIAESGKLIPTRIDTICLHGDTAGAVTIAGTVRAALEAAGVAVRRF